MRRTRSILFRTLFVFSLWGLVSLSVPPSAQTTCIKLKATLDREAENQRRLEEDQRKLNEQFSESVQRDMASQAEGLLDEFSRAKAMKVSFARRKLAKLLASSKALAAKLRRNYCESCFYERGDDATKEAYCKGGG